MIRRGKRSVVNVCCPIASEELVHEVLSRLNISYTLNNLSSESEPQSIVCHFKAHQLSEEDRSALIEATEGGAWVEPLVSFVERKFGYSPIELLDSSYFLQQKAFSILTNSGPRAVKRVLDVAVGVLSLIVFSPILLLTAIAVRLDSPGSVFYKQKRVGLFNKEYYVVKFRSMTENAEKNGAQWAAKDDCRVTRVGKFIRKTRIDELPQLFNVIKGEMSLIGPRPEREVFVKQLEKEIPYYRFRHSVKPGITGLAQVKYPYGASVEDAKWKHRYDLHYIKHHNTWMDVKIALLTVKTVLFAKGQ